MLSLHPRRQLLLLSAAAFLAGLSGVSAAQPARPAAPSTKDKAALLATVQGILEKGVGDSAFPGAIAVIGNHRGPFATAAAGHLDWAPSPAPDRHTMWDLASLTKVTAMTSAMMQLVEAGEVDLDAPVQRYLPDWTGANKDRVTVRHLLTHSGGLPPDWPRGHKPYDEITHDPDSVAKLMYWTPLDTLPGSKMVYSDIGAYVLGRIIEKVSSQPLDMFVHDHVFMPLGMEETMYRPPYALRPRIAPTERDTVQRLRLVVGMVHDERSYYIGGVSGHAGVFSSADDLEKLCRAYLNGGALGNSRLAKESTIRMFTTVQDSLFSSRALGWDTPKDSWFGHYVKRPAFGHTGFTGTSIIIAPQYDLYIILLTNRVNPTRAASKITPVRVAVADATMRLLFPEVVKQIDSKTPSR